MTQIEIQIGSETWAYEYDENYTHIYDDDGERVVVLRWRATDGEIRAAAYGFGAGRHIGKKQGAAEKVAEIKRALEYR